MFSCFLLANQHFNVSQRVESSLLLTLFFFRPSLCGHRERRIDFSFLPISSLIRFPFTSNPLALCAVLGSALIACFCSMFPIVSLSARIVFHYWKPLSFRTKPYKFPLSLEFVIIYSRLGMLLVSLHRQAR